MVPGFTFLARSFTLCFWFAQEFKRTHTKAQGTGWWRNYFRKLVIGLGKLLHCRVQLDHGNTDFIAWNNCFTCLQTWHWTCWPKPRGIFQHFVRQAISRTWTLPRVSWEHSAEVETQEDFLVWSGYHPPSRCLFVQILLLFVLVLWKTPWAFW